MGKRLAGKGRLRHGAAALLISFCPLLAISAAQAFDAGKAGFKVKYKEETSPYRVNAAFLMPGENLELQVAGKEPGRFTLEMGSGTAGADSIRGASPDARAWTWKAPDSAGLYPLRLRRDSTDDTILINAFVMVPATAMRDGRFGGYQIGTYPKSPLKGLEFYRLPQGFIRVDDAVFRARISPHFTLGQFVCKQSPQLPAYVLLKERLILKLELVLEKANEQGYACETFHVMSGYRTPFYNKLIGNVKFSAHQFGGAADIFIDAAPLDGEMDDLNGDGVNDGKDSEMLFNLVDGMSINEYFLPYIGGIGKYSKNRSHGAFVHVDVRGFRAVW
jgi:hypothetical protein